MSPEEKLWKLITADMTPEQERQAHFRTRVFFFARKQRRKEALATIRRTHARVSGLIPNQNSVSG